MIEITTEQFEKYVTEAIDRLPQPYKSNINNIAFFVDEEPTTEQLNRLGLRPCHSLFGLYEGVPLPLRGGNSYNLLPDRITIFKKTHQEHSNNIDELKLQVANTVWHEVAHYFGLDHKQIRELERKL